MTVTSAAQNESFTVGSDMQRLTGLLIALEERGNQSFEILSLRVADTWGTDSMGEMA